MEKTVIKAMLGILHKDTEVFSTSKVREEIMSEYNIGRRKGTSLIFDSTSKIHLCRLLEGAGIVNPLATTPDSWDGLSRAESLSLGSNEKMTSSAVQRNRVALKVYPGETLALGSVKATLGAAMHLEVDGQLIEPDEVQHSSVLFVENWESFNAIERTSFTLHAAGANPLIIWRGTYSGCRTDASLDLVRRLKLPVWAYIDFDPAGLGIAQALPQLAGVIAPSIEQLDQRMKMGIAQRYLDQISQWQDTLDNANHPDIQRLWRVIKLHGKALPQEAFISPSKTGFD